jgi:predicted phosphoadenosine phosphosulfate sulfurtransferase
MTQAQEKGAARQDRSHLSTGRFASKQEVDQDVYSLALERTREAFRLFDTVAVSFSGGKDSTAVLNVALQVAREDGHDGRLIVFHYDEEAIAYETESYVRRVSQLPEVDLRWLCLPVKHRNGCSRKSPFWYPWGPEDRDKWVRPLPPEGITEVEGFRMEVEHRPSLPGSVGLLFPPEEYGRVGMLLGIRADESITRTRSVLMRSQDSRNYIRPWNDGFARGNLFKVMPIYDWRTADVWTAPKLFGWDYNTAYDLMELAGMTHHQQRIAPPYGEEPMQNLWMYRECFPDIWDKMQSRVPGAATGARYSTTELYSFGSVPSKPDGVTWEEFLRHQLMKHPEEYRASIAAKVQGHIRVHFRKTSEPLAAKAPHPDSGEFWNRLLMIAVRGDYKGRKAPRMAGDPERMRVRYDAEIAKMRAEGEL